MTPLYKDEKQGDSNSSELQVQQPVIKSLPEAQAYARALTQWARERWGVKTERVYLCPACGSKGEYECYCSNDGKKMKPTVVESESQDYFYNLESFIYFPDDPLEVTT